MRMPWPWNVPRFSTMVARRVSILGARKNVFDNNGLLFYLKVVKQIILPMVCAISALASCHAFADAPVADANSVDADVQALRVQSIVYSRYRQRAVVNGQTVAVGQNVGDATVT